MATSPTQLSLKWLKEQGYLAEVVERWIPGANIRKDLWGWCDIIAIKDEETVAVQCTSWNNISSRVRKVSESETIGAVRKANWTVWVIGWKKKDNRWVHKLVDCS